MRTANFTTTFLVATTLAFTAALAPATRADFSVTVNPDGTITRTEATASTDKDKDKKDKEKKEKTVVDPTGSHSKLPRMAPPQPGQISWSQSIRRDSGTTNGETTTTETKRPVATEKVYVNGRLFSSREIEANRLGCSPHTYSYGQYYPATPGYYYPSTPAYSYPEVPYSVQLPTPLGPASPWITSIPGPPAPAPRYYCPPPVYAPACPPPVGYYPSYPAYPTYPAYPGYYNPYPYGYGYGGTGGVYSSSSGTYGSFSIGTGGVHVSIGGSRQTTSTSVFGR